VAKKKKGNGQEPRWAQEPDQIVSTGHLGKKHRATLAALFAKPIRVNIAWVDFVSLMEALGATVRSAGGSAHSFTLNQRIGVFHRPHPGNELYPQLVRRIRGFLNIARVHK
jgi:hypothetical protein